MVSRGLLFQGHRTISPMIMLSEKFLEKARVELREDEKRKEQALEHFREWINKHPYIRSIRQGEQ